LDSGVLEQENIEDGGDQPSVIKNEDGTDGLDHGAFPGLDPIAASGWEFGVANPLVAETIGRYHNGEVLPNRVMKNVVLKNGLDAETLPGARPPEHSGSPDRRLGMRGRSITEGRKKIEELLVPFGECAQASST
jgi:hypothetical protein